MFSEKRQIHRRLEITIFMEERPSSAPVNNRSEGTKITVVVRVRPPNQKESMSNQGNVIHIMDDRVLVFDPPGERIRKETFIQSSQERAKNLSFGFDKVIGPDASQEDVFDVIRETIFDIDGGLLAGFNCTVFAYGATGSGKTFSMAGSNEQPGIMTRSVEYIFQALSAQTGRRGHLKISYLEIYNEEIRDLLIDPREQSNSKPLNIVEDPDKGIYVTNISYCYPKDTQEVLELIQVGNSRRTQAATDSNPVSSRSHAICQIEVENADGVPGMTTTTNVGKLSLIDLAGSERATTNTGCRLRETTKINQSLLALSKCLNALCTQHMHVPFRESKLTRLLHDSLGGNCRTVCLSCVSPSYLTYEDTYNTLKYADKAKNIRTNVQKNTINVKARVEQYAQMIAVLREQVKSLQNQVQNKEYIDSFKESIKGPFISQKLELQRFFAQENHEFPEGDDLKQNVLACQRIYSKNEQIKNRSLQSIQVFLSECNKRRPSMTPNHFIDNEQKLKALELENFALKNNLDFYEKMISMQQSIICQLTSNSTVFNINSTNITPISFISDSNSTSNSLNPSGEQTNSKLSLNSIQERLEALQHIAKIPLSNNIASISFKNSQKTNDIHQIPSATSKSLSLQEVQIDSLTAKEKKTSIQKLQKESSLRKETVNCQFETDKDPRRKMSLPLPFGKLATINKKDNQPDTEIEKTKEGRNQSISGQEVPSSKGQLSITDMSRIKAKNSDSFSIKRNFSQLVRQRVPLSTRNYGLNNLPDKTARDAIIDKLKERIKNSSNDAKNTQMNGQGLWEQAVLLNKKPLS